MHKIKYILQFIGITFLLCIYKLLGLKFSSTFSGYIFLLVGPIIRSNKLAQNNLKKAFPNLDFIERKKILDKMWFNYGRIFSEYMFIKKFRNSTNFSNKIIIENQEILEKIKLSQKPVIFISGHFNNFELMAMHIDCLLYTSDAADDSLRVDLGGRRIIKKHSTHSVLEASA